MIRTMIEASVQDFSNILPSLSTWLLYRDISQHDKQHLLNIIDAMMKNEAAIPDVNLIYPGMDPPIFLVLQVYPQTSEITKRLCEIGCNLEAQVQCQAYGDEDQEPES